MHNDHVFYRNLLAEYPTIVRGEGVFVYDSEGKRYLDSCSGANVTDLGYGVEEIIEAMTQQARKIGYVHASRFRSEPIIEMADRVVEMAPAGLNRVYFVPGGSEANESALKLARQYHLGNGNLQKYIFVGRWQCFHGGTIAALSMTGKTSMRRELGPLLLRFPHIVPPYCYRCPLGQSYPGCEVACADELERMALQSNVETISGFITEVINGPSIAGLTPPPEYYPRIREICDKYDLLFVVDEVMTGFGRTGANFAIDHWGVTPDIITFGKGIAGGYGVLGGLIVADEITDVLIQKREGQFYNSYSHCGDPLSTAVGAAVLKFIKAHDLVEKARQKGEYLLTNLKELAGKHPTMGDVRGKGLQLGVEFVKDKETKEPFPTEI